VKTTFEHKDMRVHATPDGVQVQFKRRMPSPVLPPGDTRALILLLTDAIRTVARHERESK
jgi:hypothetical protein